MIRTVGISFFLLGSAVACTPAALSAADYDTSCEDSSDCVIATFGDPCAACSTDFAAINDAALGALAADRKAATDACPPWSERFHVDCILAQPQTRPLCTDGRCVIPETGGDACTFEDGFCRGVDPP